MREHASLTSVILLRLSPPSDLGRRTMSYAIWLLCVFWSLPEHWKLRQRDSIALVVLFGRGKAMTEWFGVLQRTLLTKISLPAKERDLHRHPIRWLWIESTNWYKRSLLGLSWKKGAPRSFVGRALVWILVSAKNRMLGRWEEIKKRRYLLVGAIARPL